MHIKLFIPGPVEVYPDVLNSLSTPMIGHRTKAYTDLHGQVKSKLQKLLYTNNKVFLSTSSATGVMEGCVRNCSDKRILSCSCGEFGDRWFEIAKVNGKETDALKVDPGKAVKPDMIDKALSSGKYDAILVTHNETSTGVMNPLAEIGEVMKKYPDVIFMVDAVSSMASVKIEVDKWGIDVCLSSTQKGFALPPGFAVFSVTKKALDKSKTVKNAGYYFSFPEFEKFDEKNQTPTTPSLPHIFALNYQLDKFFKEGLDNKFNRVKDMAMCCRDWAKKGGFGLFAEPGYESITLTTINNDRNINIGELNKELGKKGFMISAGYGKFKDTNFRIAHMGDTTKDELKELLSVIDATLKSNPALVAAK
jgi:predicted phosphoserine aminotransferase